MGRGVAYSLRWLYVRGVWVSENVRKLVGVVVMAVLVVAGVVMSSGDEDFTRNGVFAKLDGIRGDVKADGTLNLDTGPINKINNEVGPITIRGPLSKPDYGEFRYQPDNDLKLVEAVRLGGQEGEALSELLDYDAGVVGEYEGEYTFESKRRNVVALGGDIVASVIVDDNHFRDVGDPASALKKLGENMKTLVVDDKSVGGRGPISKVVNNDLPTLAIQTDDGLTLGPLGGDGVFISIDNDLLNNEDTSEYTEVEWTYLQKSLLEASENLQRIAKELDIWTNGQTTR